MDRAREAAEDLFKPRREPAERRTDSAVANPANPDQPQPQRQPRVIMIPAQMASSAAPSNSPSTPAPVPRRRRISVRRETPSIPASQFGRVRALASYGMTREQVAELYAVPVTVIDRIVGPEESSAE